MLICAIDTSGREGSVALAEGDANSFEVLHLSQIAGGTYSAQLIPQISAALQACGKSKQHIELLVAASGPGSFTGLRVGLSTVKALAGALRKPLVAPTVLETMAFAIGADGTFLTALDAQRNEVFVGEYKVRHRRADSALELSCLQEALVGAPDFQTWLGARVPTTETYTSDALLAGKLRASGLPVRQVLRPSADAYAKLGLERYLRGETDDPDTLDANYIRRSDAEIFSAPKLRTPPR